MSYQNICYIIAYQVALQCKYCTMIYCIVLQCVILWYIFVYTVILWVSILSYIGLYYIRLQYIVLGCGLLDHVLWCCVKGKYSICYYMACWLFSNVIVVFELLHGSSSDSHITNVFDNGRGYLTTAPPRRPRDHRDIVRLALYQMFLLLELLHAWLSTYSQIK